MEDCCPQSEIHLILSRGLSGDDWDLIKILELFEAELRAREMAATSQSKRSVPGRAPPTASTLVVPTTLSCAYCGQSHTSVSCPTVQTVEARREWSWILLIRMTVIH